jgi:menaquinone-dependent protoporphyrinogen oxidase
MKTAIIYTTSHGTTEKIANTVAEGIGSEHLKLINLKKEKVTDLVEYDQVIIGGSIHAGNIQNRMKKFMDANMELLLQKRIGLFLCCMHEEEADKQFENAFPQSLRNHAIATMCPGGEFNFDRMNFIERAIVKKVAYIENSVSKIDPFKIDQFINQLKNN